MPRKAAIAFAAVLLAAAAVWAVVGLVAQFQDNAEQEQIFDRLRGTVQAKSITDLSGETGSGTETAAGASGQEKTGHDISLLQEENSDCIGWVSIEGTNLDYPVMQTLDEPEYYLKRSFEKSPNEHGVPFLDARCSVDRADNLIVYGHHMNDGTMFSCLHKYAKYSYYEEHPLITWETANGIDQYRVAAVMRASGTVYEKDWSIFNCIYMNELEFEEMSENLLEKSLYNTGIAPVYGDKLLTLATCEYSQENGRLVVVAVKQ